MIPKASQVRNVLPRKGVGLLFLANAIIYGVVLWIRKGFSPYGTVEYKAEFSWIWAAVFLSLSLLYILIYHHVDKAPAAFIIGAYLVFSLLLILTPVLFS